MKKIAIIGSDSFIATRFYESFKNKYEFRLFCLKSSNKPKEIVKDLFKITRADLTDIYVVINFAAIVHQTRIKNNSLIQKVNTQLPIHIANMAKSAGVEHFIQMSSIGVYGTLSNIDINSRENPDTIYGKTKLDADCRLIKLIDEEFKVSLIRPPMVYGGGNAPGNLQKLILFAQKGFPMPFKGINNLRDFIHVNNLGYAINELILRKHCGILLPTDKQSISTEQILKFAKKHSKKRIRIIRPSKIILTLIKIFYPNLYIKLYGSCQVKCNFEFQSRFSLEDGIKEMIEYLH